MTVAYPVSLPMDCFRTVTEILRDRAVMDRGAEFAHCLWNVQGFIQKLALGDGPAHASGSFGAAAQQRREQAANDQNLKELARQLQDFQGEVNSGEANSMMLAAGPNDSQFNPVAVLSAVSQILALLKMLKVFNSAGDQVDRGVAHGFQDAGSGGPDSFGSQRQMAEASAQGPKVTGPADGQRGMTTGEGSSNDVAADTAKRESGASSSEDWRAKSLTDLGLDTRTVNALNDAGLKTAGEVADYGDKNDGLTKITGIGTSTQQDIQKALQKAGKKS